MTSTQSESRRKMSALEKRNTLIAYSFLAPNFIGFVIFTLVPVVFSFVLAFMNWSGGQNITFAGLDNFRLIFKDFSFAKSNLGIALKNTVFYTAMTVPLTLVFALGLALILNKVRGAGFFRAVIFFPYVASLVAICVCWNFLLMKNGPVNQILNAVGFNMKKSWTSSRDLAIWAIIIVSVWRNAGYYMVMYLAGLQGVPAELYEAATMDGANGWQKFTKVTLPMLTPTTFFCSIMMVISCFKIYDVVAIMTQGGPGRSTKMLVTYIFELSFGGENIATSAQYGVASAVSMVLLAIVLIVTFVQFRGEKKWVNYM
ncbi:MAG: sugar ABC transporter permease [Clostridia bacterium]|nr:sugar ABC transporter permease [Clostridia bacterium]MBQ6858598.1 sugar ABC transporter permease [Clostridia bacterium]MBQ7052239.1 sugar ABC transporter permease [Clostridia bacterium]